jgi:hypothetical protein
MCIIIDTNLAPNVFQEPANEEYEPIIRWLLSKDGMMVYGGKLATELTKISAARRTIRVLQEAGHAHHQNDAEVNIEENRIIETKLCVSDDPHIIALARLTGARTLCSHDTDLHKDFKNKSLIDNPRGCIYQDKGHLGLLRHSTSCLKK